MLQVAHHTSWFGALILTGWLKLLHVFQLIPWHPTSFLKTTTDVAFFRFILLFVLLYGLFFLCFMIFCYLPYRGVFIIALVIGGVISFGLNSWFEGQWLTGKEMKNLNIPFLVSVLFITRFLLETATFHKKSLHGRTYHRLS